MQDSLRRQFLHPGVLSDQIAIVSESIRSRPERAPLRVHVARLCMLTRHWDRADAPLQSAADLDHAKSSMAALYRGASGDQIRGSAFGGRARAPRLGDAGAWLALLTDAPAHEGTGDSALANRLRKNAREVAPATAFPTQSDEIVWIGDAESRLGRCAEP